MVGAIHMLQARAILVYKAKKTRPLHRILITLHCRAQSINTISWTHPCSVGPCSSYCRLFCHFNSSDDDTLFFNSYHSFWFVVHFKFWIGDVLASSPLTYSQESELPVFRRRRALMGINQLSTKAVVSPWRHIKRDIYKRPMAWRCHFWEISYCPFTINCPKWYSSQFAKHLTKRIK